MSNWQLNELKLGTEKNDDITWTFSLNVIGESNGENNFPYKLLLTSTQVLRLSKAFANGLSVNTKLLKTQFCKVVQFGNFLFPVLLQLKNQIKFMGKTNKTLLENKDVAVPAIYLANNNNNNDNKSK